MELHLDSEIAHAPPGKVYIIAIDRTCTVKWASFITYSQYTVRHHIPLVMCTGFGHFICHNYIEGDSIPPTDLAASNTFCIV